MSGTETRRKVQSVNPATGEVFASFLGLTDAELDQKLETAQQTFHVWRKWPIAERAKVLVRLGDLLESGAHDLATVMTGEMGKTFAQARGEVLKSAMTCRYYAEHAAGFLADEPFAMPNGKAWIRYLPLGPVLAVMPWNFPIWQVVRFLAPALAAGNVGLLKHASSVPQCAIALERLVLDAGAPEGVFQNLFIESRLVERVILDRRVVAVTLTGSESAGISVATAAGKALKPAVLELGGSDPFIVMPSADIEYAARMAVTARMTNNGQSCVCAKRFIAHESIYERFQELFLAGVAALKVGDPMDAATDVGPVSSATARADLHKQVEDAIASGAKLLAGGAIPAGPGFYYPPTVLAEIPEGAPVRQEEFFGPVAMLFRARDITDAIKIANDIPFGLGSALWSNDEAEIEEFLRDTEAGCSAVNTLVASDPRVPFGGIKKSGYGRELSTHGMREFMNVKTVLRG